MKKDQRSERDAVIIDSLNGVVNKTTEMRRLAKKYGITERRIREIVKKNKF